MDIKDLKKAWDQLSSKEQGNILDETQLKEMLGKRTKSLSERIERNIKIGFYIFAVFILFIALDYVTNSFIIERFDESLKIPSWVYVLDIVTNLFIIVTFLIFVQKYFKIKKQANFNNDLKNTLKRVIHILKIYEKLFFYAIAIFVITISVNTLVGMYMGFDLKSSEMGISISELGTKKLILTLLLGFFVLTIIAFGFIRLFRWGFRRLYGNYLHQLRVTLKELEEIR